MEITTLNLNGAEPAPPTQSEVRWQIAMLAAIAVLAASFAARYLFGVPLPPELLADFIFAVLPIWLIEFGVSLLGPFAKHLAFIGCVALYLLTLTGLARLIIEKGLPRHSPLARALSSYSGGGRTGVWIGRRRVVRWMGYAVVGVAAYDIGRALLVPWLKSGAGRVRGGSGVFPDLDGLAREVTPTGDFYDVSKNTADPEVDVKRWKLEIGGQVENALSLTYDDIKQLPSVEQYATLECISNSVGGDLIGNASWRGVRLKELLDRAVPKAGVVDIVLRASDGYADSIPLDRAMAEGSILAYEMNGAPLNSTHGFPLRLIVPGIYGMKNVKWITRVEAVAYDFKGYWQARGWDDRALYKTMSRIDVPQKTVTGDAAIAGIAFAGDRSIAKVEVSTDGGKTWESAQLKAALSPYSWVLWHKDWTGASAGSHLLLVRATDGQGIVQTSQHAPPIPDGASGYDSRRVQVG
jgi:DMSO/TMAO reductase YedYZ molybdopterin-dependent catalytic subunit